MTDRVTTKFTIRHQTRDDAEALLRALEGDDYQVENITSEIEMTPDPIVVVPPPVKRNLIPVGKGIFIWHLGLAVKDVGDLAAWVAEIQSDKFDWVALKVAERTDAFGDATEQALTAKAVSALRSVGLGVGGWHYVYGDKPVDEAAIAVKVTRGLDLDFYAIDAEDEYKTQDKVKAAQIYIDLLGDGIASNHGIGLCSYRYPNYHAELPWKEFLSWCRFHMPQVYWEGLHNPMYQLGRSINQLQKLKAIPVVPVGSAYSSSTTNWKPTVADLQQFFEAAQKTNCPGCGWWAWHSAYHVREWWDEIARQQWATQ